MTILITGGTGFLGSYLTRYALEEGGQDHVVILDRYAERGRIADLLGRVTIIEGDVGDYATVASVMEAHDIDQVAHFAFILGSPAVGQMLPYVRVQTCGTVNVLEAARLHGVQRVLFASSVAAYGRQDVDLLTEDLLPNPVDPYGASKVWSESMARHYTDRLGLEVVTIRYGSTFGLGRAARGSYKSGILHRSNDTHYMARVEAAARGDAITLPRGDAVVDWTYAADGAQAAWLALRTKRLPHHLFNVGSYRHSVDDFVQAIQQVLPSADISLCATETPGNPHLPMDTARLRSLGFTPKYSLADGVRDYVHRLQVFDDYEAGQVLAI